VFEAITEEYDCLEDALQRYPWSCLGACGRDRAGPTGHLTAYVEDPAGPLVRQDVVRTNQARQYGFRQAKRMEVTPQPAAERSRS